MTTAGLLDQGRDAFQRHAWANAYAQLSAADQITPLAPEDLEQLAAAAWLTGRHEEGADLLARAYRALVARGDPVRAARCAFWLAYGSLQRGESGRAAGWLARARRLLDDGGLDCAEQGYVLLPTAMQRVV